MKYVKPVLLVRFKIFTANCFNGYGKTDILVHCYEYTFAIF